jgi:hypothetical protein
VWLSSSREHVLWCHGGLQSLMRNFIYRKCVHTLWPSSEASVVGLCIGSDSVVGWEDSMHVWALQC